jgi:hypothetical protein
MKVVGYFAMVTLFFLSVGCSTMCKNGLPKEEIESEYEKDLAECKIEAMEEISAGYYFYGDDYVYSCMVAKGWTKCRRNGSE